MYFLYENSVVWCFTLNILIQSSRSRLSSSILNSKIFHHWYERILFYFILVRECFNLIKIFFCKLKKEEEDGNIYKLIFEKMNWKDEFLLKKSIYVKTNNIKIQDSKWWYRLFIVIDFMAFNEDIMHVSFGRVPRLIPRLVVTYLMAMEFYNCIYNQSFHNY